MPRTIAVEVYQFSELSDAAKEKAREWYRECEAQDFAPCYEQYDTAAKLLGIEIDDTGRKQYGVISIPDIYDADGNELDAELCDEFLEIMRDFAQWIYDGLEAEYDYRMSDEAVDEAMEANEYEFDEDGDRI